MLFVILVLILAVVVASPYICVVVKRRRMLGRLIEVATRAGYSIRPLHKFVCFSLNTSDRYDILIQNSTHAYPVKLWSTAKRNSTLVISADGRVYETTGVSDPLKTDTSRDHTVNGRERRVKPTRQNYTIKGSKTVTPILLYYPCNKRAVADLGIKQRKIEFGDRIFGKTLCSPPMLEKMLTAKMTAVRRR